MAKKEIAIMKSLAKSEYSGSGESRTNAEPSTSLTG